MNGGAANPFDPRVVLGMVLFGAAVFVLLLWMVGAGMTAGSVNDGGGHVGGKGLNGYAALAALLEKRGYPVRRSMSAAALDDAGLLVLTPPQYGDGKKIGDAIAKHRYSGPTILVLPKWIAAKVPKAMQGTVKSGEGWVMLAGTAPPLWGDEVTGIGKLDLRSGAEAPRAARWSGMGHAGALPSPKEGQSLSSGSIVPLVRDENGQTLAGYLGDDGFYPDLADAAGVDGGKGEDDDIYPVVLVAEPDLLDNYGMADRDRAALALELIRAVSAGKRSPVIFDLTMNGHARTANLLTLAFTPPFLAATLCLLLGALGLGWRAFLRFGPPRRPVRAIAFGKRALVANAASLIRRSGRIHLVAGPFADAVRERLARSLALPRLAETGKTEAAIDRALAARRGEAAPFTSAAARLRAARHAQDALKAAQDLHSLERMLKQ